MLMLMPRKRTNGTLPMPCGANRVRQQDSGEKRNRDAGCACGQTREALAAQLLVFQLQADRKQEQDEPDGRELFHAAERGDRKQMMTCDRREPAEDRWAEQYAADNLADNTRLADLARNFAAREGDKQNNGNL
jgi:hypothetical protein